MHNDATRIFRVATATAVQLNSITPTNTTTTTTSTTASNTLRLQLLQYTAPLLSQVPVPIAVDTIAQIVTPQITPTGAVITSTLPSTAVLQQALLYLANILTIQQQQQQQANSLAANNGVAGNNLNSFNLQLCTSYVNVISGLLQQQSATTTTTGPTAIPASFSRMMATYSMEQDTEQDDIFTSYTTSSSSSSRHLLALVSNNTQSYTLVNNTMSTLVVILQSNLDTQLVLASETISVSSSGVVAYAHRDYGYTTWNMSVSQLGITLNMPSNSYDPTTTQTLWDTRLVYMTPNPYAPLDDTSIPSQSRYTYFPFTLLLDIANSKGVQQSLSYATANAPTLTVNVNTTCGDPNIPCPYECVTWNLTSGYTTVGISTNQPTNTTLTCTPTSSPQYIAIRYQSTVTTPIPTVQAFILPGNERAPIQWYVLFFIGLFLFLSFIIFWILFICFRRYQTKNQPKEFPAPDVPIRGGLTPHHGTAEVVPGTEFISEDFQSAPDFVLGQTQPDIFHYDIAQNPDYQSVFALSNNPLHDDEKMNANPNNLFHSPVLINDQRLRYDDGVNAGAAEHDPEHNPQRDIHFTLSPQYDPQVGGAQY